MEGIIRRSFALDDTAVGLQLTWHEGASVPDFDSVPAVAAQACETGYRWATAHAACPHCHRSFQVTPHMPTHAPHHGRAATAAEPLEQMFLTGASVPLLMMLGNLSADPDARPAVACPHCAQAFVATLSQQRAEMVVCIGDERVAVICPDGGKVFFLPDGVVSYHAPALCRQPHTEEEVFLALPGSIGASSEGRELLRKALCLPADAMGSGNAIDLLDLALRHRFRGYDARFYDQAKRLLSTYGVRPLVAGALFELPRHFSRRGAVQSMFRESGLVDKPSVRKAAGSNLVSLALLAAYGLGRLCGGDPNLAVALLTSKNVDAIWVDALLDSRNRVGDFVELAMKEEEPAYLVDRLFDLDAKTLAECVVTCERLCPDLRTQTMAYREAREHASFSDIVKNPRLLSAYRRDALSPVLKYGRHTALQGEYDGFLFELPAKTAQLVAAGAELKNCLGDYAEQVALGDKLVFLVSKGSHLVAAVELRPFVREVSQMFAKANRKIQVTEDLGLAIARWAQDKGLCLSGSVYA